MNQKGTTIIELIFVLAFIIGMGVALVVPHLGVW